MNKRSVRDQKGAVIVVVVAALFALIAFAGLAIDAGQMTTAKTQLQNVADAAALACVIHGTSSPCTVGSPTVAAVNPRGYTLQIENPATCPDPTSQASCIKVVASTPLTLALSRIGGSNTTTVRATAIAGSILQGASCVATQGNFSANGNNTFTVTGCGVSVGGNLAMGGSRIVVSGSQPITVYGGSIDCNNCSPIPVRSSSALPPLATGSIPSNLTAATLPTTCPSNICTMVPNTTYSGKVTLNSSRTYNFPAGAYVSQGGLDVNKATVKGPTVNGAIVNNGTGVTLYIPSGMPLDMTGTIRLSAPTTCAEGEQSYVIFNPGPASGITAKWAGANVDIQLTGFVNLSGQNLEINGTSARLNITGSFIANSVLLSGGMSQTVSNNGCFNLNLPGSIALFQ